MLFSSSVRCCFACSRCCSAILHSHLTEGVGCTFQPWSGTLDDSRDELSRFRQTDHTGHVRYTVYQHYRHLLQGSVHSICYYNDLKDVLLDLFHCLVIYTPSMMQETDVPASISCQIICIFSSALSLNLPRRTQPKKLTRTG